MIFSHIHICTFTMNIYCFTHGSIHLTMIFNIVGCKISRLSLPSPLISVIVSLITCIYYFSGLVLVLFSSFLPFFLVSGLKFFFYTWDGLWYFLVCFMTLFFYFNPASIACLPIHTLEWLDIFGFLDLYTRISSLGPFLFNRLWCASNYF